MRTPTISHSFRRWSLRSLSRSSVGTESMKSTSPASSAAVRDGGVGDDAVADMLPGRLLAPIGVVAVELDAVARAEGDELNGPVPIAALPLLKSSVVAFAATLPSTMKTCVKSIGSSG